MPAHVSSPGMLSYCDGTAPSPVPQTCCVWHCVLDACLFPVSPAYEPWTTKATETDNAIKVVVTVMITDISIDNI